VKHKLIVRPRAEIDRTAQFLYLADRNPQAALRFDQAVSAALKKIKADPGIGTRLNLPRVEHLDLRFYRPTGFDHHLIIFRVESDRIYVSRILHSSQDIESAMLNG
jgi:plasmid stabilization system protein ParE